MVTKTLPYPKVRVEGRNGEYARMMLGNFGGGNSEMSSISLYLYNQLVMWNEPEIVEVFHTISIEEMRHLEIFGGLARMLGADPRMWERKGSRMQYWSPGYVKYHTNMEKLLQNSLEGELASIDKYERQIRRIKDIYIVEILERVIIDEQEHVQIFKNLLESIR